MLEAFIVFWVFIWKFRMENNLLVYIYLVIAPEDLASNF